MKTFVDIAKFEPVPIIVLRNSARENVRSGIGEDPDVGPAAQDVKVNLPQWVRDSIFAAAESN